MPELEQWNGEFWRPNREFFSKNREFSAKIESSTSGATRKSVGRSHRLRDARPPTRSSLPHDRSTARPGRFRRLAIAGGPRAFHPAAQPSIGRPLPISRGHTSLFSPPGGAGAQYLLGNVLFVMAITYVGDALPIAYCNRIHGWEAIARKSSGRLSSAMPVRWKMTRSPIEAGRRRV